MIKIVISLLFFTMVTPSIFAYTFPFKQAGYLRDSNKNRIYTYKLEADITKSQILNFALIKPNTPGHLTAIYFYTNNTNPPGDEITYARNILEANEIIDNANEKWRYVYIVFINGNYQLADCYTETNHPLCQ